jgi:hypothetical protein
MKFKTDTTILMNGGLSLWEINDQSGQHEANKKLSTCNASWHSQDISRMAGSPQV